MLPYNKINWPIGRELDAHAEFAIFGHVPCDKWVHQNLGSAGGPVMVLGGFRRGTYEENMRCVKENKTLDEIIGPPCPHGDKCYPLPEGKFFGPRHLSSNWEATKAIISEMKGRGYVCSIRDSSSLLGSDASATFTTTNIGNCSVTGSSATGDTVPHAVVLAALRVLQLILPPETSNTFFTIATTAQIDKATHELDEIKKVAFQTQEMAKEICQKLKDIELERDKLKKLLRPFVDGVNECLPSSKFHTMIGGIEISRTHYNAARLALGLVIKSKYKAK